MRILIAKEIMDVSTWPTVSINSLGKREAKIVLRRMQVMRAYLEGAKMKSIKAHFNYNKDQVWKLFRRCIKQHRDGRVWGFRACLPYIHVKDYDRQQESPATKFVSHSGHSGSMGQLFDRFPHILEAIIERALQNRNKRFIESSLGMARLHTYFIQLCKSAGVKNNEYPFNVKYLGERSFRTRIKKEIFQRNIRAAVAVTYGDDAARRLGSDGPSPRIGRKTLPYERVEFDAHRIDVHTIKEIPDPKGGEPLFMPLERIWILAVIDTCSRAILGYSISLNRHYTSEDVLVCLENCIKPWRPRELTIPGLIYAEGGGLPSGVIPELAYATFGELAFDNDKSHLGEWVTGRTQQIIGCSLNPGPIKTPESRQYIERYFREFEVTGFQRLPSTTGSGPDDPRRRDPERKASKHRVRLDEIIELIDVLISNYNISSTSALHGRSPLEYLRFALDRQSFFVRTIPEPERAAFSLTLKTIIVKLRCYLEQGVRPFVEIENVRYYGPRLNNSVHLKGEKLHVEIQTQDMRTVKAFLPNGEEFETLTAARAWAGSVHDLQTRKAIQRENQSKRLENKNMPDAIEAYVQFKQGEKIKTKKTNNQIVRTMMIKNKEPESLPAGVVKPAKRQGYRPTSKLSKIHTTGANY